MTEHYRLNNLPEQFYPENITRLGELELKIEVLEKLLKELVARQPINIEKICIHKIDADKIEMKLEDIDVKKLCGMLKLDVETAENSTPKETET